VWDGGRTHGAHVKFVPEPPERRRRKDAREGGRERERKKRESEGGRQER